MKRLKFFLSIFLVASCLLLVANPASAAEVETYPGGVGTQANATSDGWTDNHLIGQSFTPQNINKVTKIKLTNFKLGDAFGNKGGIVSVALFQGEPTASTVYVGGRGTTQISPSGAMLTKVGKIFIGPGNAPANDLASFCGVPHNIPPAHLLKRLNITNPDRPCPRQSEWTRAYNDFLTNQGQRDDWVSNWGQPYGSNVIFGDSTFNWTNIDQADQASLYTGPGWTSKTVSWQGTDNADNYLEVTLPTHSLVPGQPYFLSIQQSYFNQADYYEEGKYNCAGPNETGIVTLQGTNINGNTVQLSGETCDKGHVFVAQIDTGNHYTGGRAYFNTYYYMNPGSYNRETGDLTDLKIWGQVPSLTTPLCISPAADSTTVNPNNLTFRWSSVPGASLYDFRLWDYNSGGWNDWNWLKESIIVNDLTNTSFNGTGGRIIKNDYGSPINLTSGQNYRYRVSARNPWEIGPWADCNFATAAPAISVKTTSKVTVQNNPNVQSGFQGTPDTSGRQAADGGANWYNFMIVTEQIDVSGTTGSNIDLAIAAFLPRIVVGGEPLSPEKFDLNYLEWGLEVSDRGFVVAYAQHNTPNPTSSPIEGSSDNSQFLAGHYYVHYRLPESTQGSWKDMGNPTGGDVDFCIHSTGQTSLETGDKYCKSNGKVRVTGRAQTDYHQASTNSLTVKWDVYTWPSFTSKKLETYGFAQVKKADGTRRMMQIPL